MEGSQDRDGFIEENVECRVVSENNIPDETTGEFVNPEPETIPACIGPNLQLSSISAPFFCLKKTDPF